MPWLRLCSRIPVMAFTIGLCAAPDPKRPIEHFGLLSLACERKMDMRSYVSLQHEKSARVVCRGKTPRLIVRNRMPVKEQVFLMEVSHWRGNTPYCCSWGLHVLAAVAT